VHLPLLVILDFSAEAASAIVRPAGSEKALRRPPAPASRAGRLPEQIPSAQSFARPDPLVTGRRDSWRDLPCARMRCWLSVRLPSWPCRSFPERRGRAAPDPRGDAASPSSAVRRSFSRSSVRSTSLRAPPPRGSRRGPRTGRSKPAWQEGPLPRGQPFAPRWATSRNAEQP